MTTQSGSVGRQAATVSMEAPVRRPALRGRLGRRRLRRGPSLVFVLPLVAFLVALVGYPIVQLVQMSVSNVTGRTLLRDWPFVGAANYRTVISSGAFRDALQNTLWFVAGVLLIALVGGLLTALAVHRAGPVPRGVLTLMVLLWALPPIVSGSLWKFLLSANGVVNSNLTSAGLVDEPVLFLSQGKLPLIAVTWVAGWVALPFAAVGFRAALQDLPRDLLEAAAVDGAGRWAAFRHVVWPALRPTALVLAILVSVYAFRSFDFIYVMTGGGPGDATTTLPYYAYVQSFRSFRFGIGAAAALCSVVAISLLALTYVRAAVERR